MNKILVFFGAFCLLLVEAVVSIECLACLDDSTAAGVMDVAQ